MLWWLVPLILATWEAEIGKMTIQGQPKHIAQETTQETISTTACACHPKLCRRLRSGGSQFQVSPSQNNLWETHLKGKKVNMVVCACHSSRKHKTGRLRSRLALVKCQNNKSKKVLANVKPWVQFFVFLINSSVTLTTFQVLMAWIATHAYGCHTGQGSYRIAPLLQKVLLGNTDVHDG
jgi:hypothetical protein